MDQVRMERRDLGGGAPHLTDHNARSRFPFVFTAPQREMGIPLGKGGAWGWWWWWWAHKEIKLNLHTSDRGATHGVGEEERRVDATGSHPPGRWSEWSDERAPVAPCTHLTCH